MTVYTITDSIRKRVVEVSWALQIDSIDLTDFILDSLYLPRFLADRTNGRAYAIAVLRPSPSDVSELWNKRCVLEQN